MADLELQRRPSGKYDFVLSGGDLRRIADPWPAVIRLLLQGPWIGDDGERSGDSLNDIRLITSKTKDQVQRIATVRLGPLIRDGQITSVDTISVVTINDRVVSNISVTIPGRQPQVIQVPLTR